MRILLTNDDGIFAPGIAALHKELVKLGEVMVVAPAEHMSGAGHSITIWQPLRCESVQIAGAFSGYSVWGSPADCVKLAVNQLCRPAPDLVVSGINDNANVGINVYYSGTVAGAVEGAFFRIPSIAVSLQKDEPMEFETASKLAIETIKKLLPLEKGTVTNINIPKLSKGMPRGIVVVPQSTTGFEEHYEPLKNEAGQTVYQLTGGPHRENGLADVTALEQGYITVTALNYDLTNHEHLDMLDSKLKRM